MKKTRFYFVLWVHPGGDDYCIEGYLDACTRQTAEHAVRDEAVHRGSRVLDDFSIKTYNEIEGVKV